MLPSAATACASSLYDLPQPPPPAEWTSSSLVPGEDDRASQRRYIDARATALQLYAALKAKRWDEAWEMLSSETQSALAYGSPNQDGLAALESGELRFPDGTSFRFEPADTLIIDDLKTFSDEQAGAVETETNLRKEIYAVSRSGESRKLVLIYETNRWKLHRTRLP